MNKIDVLFSFINKIRRVFLSFKLDEKKLIVAEIANEISNAQIVILSEYRGLKVSQFTEIRSKLREAGVFFSSD